MSKLDQISARREELLKSYPNLVDELTSIRESAVNNLTQLESQAVETLKGKGCQVYTAGTLEEARQILSKLLQGQEQVVRAYSNTLNEIELDKFLEQKNIKVFKTNLNEILTEVVNKEKNHPIYPNMELTHEDIVAGLKKYLNVSETEDIKELAKLMHKKIKEKIVTSEFGITGINSIVAENGTIILAEDEGNGRAVSNLPYQHVVIAGIDKLTYSVEEALTTIQGTTIYGLGRNNPTYYSLISGPSRTADIEFRMAYGMHGPKEVHVILVDNGRKELIAKGFKDLLKCVDCGACYQSMEKVAQSNNWSGIPFTPKGIALGIVQGKISKPTATTKVEEFKCPVSIKAQSLGKFMQNS